MNRCLFLLLLFVVATGFSLEVNLHAKSAILINADTGHALFKKKENDSFYPASITKIATALYVLEKRPDLEGIIKASKDALICVSPQKKERGKYPLYCLETDGRSLGIKVGEAFPFEFLMYAMLVGSFNDAANVIAFSFDNSISSFMNGVNEYLKTIGCKNTYFCNPHGLHCKDHVTTASDMAKISQRAIKNPKFCQIISTHNVVCPKTDKAVSQFNRLLLKNSEYYYPYAIGGKTGYHARAGYTLVAFARREGRTLIAVISGCKRSNDRYEDAIKLFEAAFNEPKKEKLLFAKDTIFERRVEGAKKGLKASLPDDLLFNTYLSEEEPLKAFIHWGSLKLPIKVGTEVGEVWVVGEEGELLKKVPIVAANDVGPSFWFKLKSFF